MLERAASRAPECREPRKRDYGRYAGCAGEWSERESSEPLCVTLAPGAIARWPSQRERTRVDRRRQEVRLKIVFSCPSASLLMQRVAIASSTVVCNCIAMSCVKPLRLHGSQIHVARSNLHCTRPIRMLVSHEIQTCRNW